MIERNRLGTALMAALPLGLAAIALAQAPAQRGEVAGPVSDTRAEARQQEMEARTQPRNAGPKVQAAMAYEAVGDVNASRKAASEALTREANNVEAMQVLARLAAREGSWGEAVAYLRRAALLDPRNAATQLALGQALEKTRDQAGSDAAYAAYRSLHGMKPVAGDQWSAR